MAVDWQRYGAGRWLAVVVLVVLLCASTQFSVGLQGKLPDWAMPIRLVPQNAATLAENAEKSVVADVSEGRKDLRAQAARQATDALLREPGNVTAATTLGLVASLDGDQSRARQWMQFSARHSRRDLRARLWLIEDAVSRGSVPEALEHYDIALRTSLRTPEILFPVLSAAVSDPEIRAGLLKLLRSGRAWRPGFEAYLAENGKDYAATIALFDGLRRLHSPPATQSDNILMSRMVTAGEVDRAWDYYRSLHRSEDPLQPRNASFRPSDVAGSPFDWSLVNDNGIAASLGVDATGGALSFSISPSIGGVVAQQTVRLPVGSYKLSGHSRAVGPAVKGYVVWKLLCSDGRELGSVPLQASDDKAIPFQATVSVPAANCGTQLLRLYALPNDDIQGSSGEVLDVRFDKVAGK